MTLRSGIACYVQHRLLRYLVDNSHVKQAWRGGVPLITSLLMICSKTTDAASRVASHSVVMFRFVSQFEGKRDIEDNGPITRIVGDQNG